jgi:hypothetical protein
VIAADPWPWPGDTATDRARRVAGSYREGLLVADPVACDGLDQRMLRLGQHWVVPRRVVLDLEERVSVDVAADHVGRSAAAVYKWISTGKLTGHRGVDGRLRVRLGDVYDTQRLLRQTRAG